MHQVQQEIASAKLYAAIEAGVSLRDAAKLCGISQGQAKKLLDAPNVQGKVAELKSVLNQTVAHRRNSDEVWKSRLAEAADASYERLMGLLENEHTEDALAVKIAQDFLDRHEHTRKAVSANNQIHAQNLQLNQNQITLAVESADEIGLPLINAPE